MRGKMPQSVDVLNLVTGLQPVNNCQQLKKPSCAEHEPFRHRVDISSQMLMA